MVFPIVYKMRKEADGNWRVHDVSIENISLVSNYRSEFAGIVRKDGFRCRESGIITAIFMTASRAKPGSPRP